MPLLVMQRQLTGNNKLLANAGHLTTFFNRFIDIANVSHKAYLCVHGHSKSIMISDELRNGHNYKLFVYNTGMHWTQGERSSYNTLDELRDAFLKATDQYLPIIRSATVKNWVLNNGEELEIYNNVGL